MTLGGLFTVLVAAVILERARGWRRINEWTNAYSQDLYEPCPDDQSVSYIKSVHSNYYQDRIWKFYCDYMALLKEDQQCEWYNDVNNYNGLLDFTCPTDYILAGASSTFSYYYEDRKWSFRCCLVDETCTLHTTRTTNFLNSYNGPMDWQSKHTIVGLYSQHSNSYEDRIWKARTRRVSGC